jgi:hypothetical protein
MYIKLDEKLTQEIIDIYNSNELKVKEISEKFKLSIGTIYKALGEHKSKKNQRKYTLNENYFNIIDSEDKAYFLGLLYSDGCNNGSGFYITLQDRDNDILQKFKNFINFNGELKFIKGKKEVNYYSLNVSSIKISKVLFDIGCNINKTVNGKFPTIVPENLMNHFIRGIFDGDGSISIDKRNQLSFSLTGKTQIIRDIANILNDKCRLNVKIRTPKRYKCDIAIYSFGGNKQAKRVQDYLYNDSTIFLERKYLKFKQYGN